jgi:hypothetical protein
VAATVLAKINASGVVAMGGTVLLEAEKRFRRIKGYREPPLPLTQLQQLIDAREAVA